MNYFPQLSSGVVTQFPFRRTRNWREIANVLESGERIALPDTNGGTIAWELRYADLSDTEAAALNSLFTASCGRFGFFVFVDPLANLIGWSEDLTRPDWQPGLLSVAGAISDPLGTQRASAVANGSAGDQQLTQSVAIPGDYVACFSVWLRADVPVPITIQRDNLQTKVAVTPQWKRYSLTGAGVSGSASSTFSLGLPAGQSVQAWGFQIEAQPYASIYRSTQKASGIYEDTYFTEDKLTIANTAPGLSSCTLSLISRV